jgi:hypothetical protein
VKRFLLRGRLRDSNKRIKDDKIPRSDSEVNDFFKYGVCEVRDKLLKIMNMIPKQGEVLSNLAKVEKPKFHS